MLQHVTVWGMEASPIEDMSERSSLKVILGPVPTADFSTENTQIPPQNPHEFCRERNRNSCCTRLLRLRGA